MQQGFTLTSPSWYANERIPPEHAYDGNNEPPRFEWSHAPEGTRSLAMIVDDPDAPGGTFTHWLLWNVPPVRETDDPTALESLGGVEGKNDFQGVGYGGPKPPPGHGDHRYRFKLYALDVDRLDLASGASRDELEEAMEGHVLGLAELVGRYQQ